MKIFRFIRKGTSHQKQGAECQDTAEYFVNSDGIAVLALSDGASQAKYAKMASECNVHAIIELFQQITPEEFMKLSEEEQKQNILGQCMRFIMERAEQEKCQDLREFSATLVFAVISSEWVLTGHVGDGAIYMADSNQRVCFSSGPENRASSRQTFFTVSQDAYDHLYLEAVERKTQNPAVAVLMSDGPQLMFKDRGFGDPEETVKEMAPFIANGLIEDDVDFGILLDQMTELEAEKLDDWSVLAALLIPSESKETDLTAQEIEEQPSESGRYTGRNTIYIPRKYYHGNESRLTDIEIVDQIVWRISPGYRVYGKRKSGEIVYEYFLRGVEQRAVVKAILVRDLVKWSPDRSARQEKKYEMEVARMRSILQTLDRMRECPNIVDIYADCEIVMEESGEVKMFLVIEKRYSVIRTCIERRSVFSRKKREKYFTLADYMRGEMMGDCRYMGVLALKVARNILNALLLLEKEKLLHGNIREDHILVDCVSGRPCFVLGGFEGARELNKENAGFDLYCLGNVLYRMLSETKEPTYSLMSWKKMRQTTYIPGLRKIIFKARSHYNGTGYKCAAEMLNDVNALEMGE